MHATYGQAHTPDTPLHLGSLKSNIGHTGAAAGVAGMLKAVLAIRHGVLPQTLHIDAPTPYVAWDGSIQLRIDNQPWPATARPRTAAVSSFGISGTNAHLVLRQPPKDEPPGAPAEKAPVLVFPISGAAPGALAAQAERLHDHLATHPDVSPLDLAHSLALTRTHLTHRAAITITEELA